MVMTRLLKIVMRTLMLGTLLVHLLREQKSYIYIDSDSEVDSDS